MQRARRERLDRLLTERGLTPNLSRAQRLIMAGRVLVDERRVDKGGTLVPVDAKISIRKGREEYVSRGGEKLAGALNHFGIDVKGLTALDVGASTGGFTDCLLKRGAAKVYAVDVGYGQLALSLRQDTRVVPLERRNARYLKLKDLGERVDIITIDVSFISLTKVIPNLLNLTKEAFQILALIKPQFEVGKGQTKKGVVKDPKRHAEVIRSISAFCQNLGLEVVGVFPSPLLGPKGNKEFFIYLRSQP